MSFINRNKTNRIVFGDSIMNVTFCCMIKKQKLIIRLDYE